MKFDTTILHPKLDEMATYTQAAEDLGFDGIWAAETNSDPFLNLLLAAEHSNRLTLGTAIAVAFPRSPAILAYTAWDLARYSGGRFVLGLGTQVKAHNTLRLGARWEKPVKQMRETIEAIRTFWDCWQMGRPLRYNGEFFNLRLMTPFFSPAPLEVPPPPIYIAAVNPQMLRLAGSHANGVHIHALHTVRYLEEVAMPEIEKGLARSGRSREDFTLATAVFVIPTDDAEQAQASESFVRQQLSFYMSTPAYRTVLALHGWEEISSQLSELARQGQWDEMPRLISDEILEAFSVSGTWAELPGRIRQRYGRLIDRISYYLPFIPGENEGNWRASIAGFEVLNKVGSTST